MTLDTTGEHPVQERIARLHAALSQVNRAIVRATTTLQMLDDVCRALVEHGGFRHVRIARLDHGRISTLAHCAAPGTPPRLPFCDSDAGSSCCPTLEALSGGATVVCNDLRLGADVARWKAAAVAQGHLSAAAFPIPYEDRIAATLGLYAGEPGVFASEEVVLLECAAADVAFGLGKLESEAARAEAERALRLWADAIVHSGRGVAIVDARTNRLLASNSAFAELIGCTADEVRGQPVSSIYAEPWHDRVFAAIASADRSGSGACSASMLHADGSTVAVQLYLVSVRDGSGEVTHRVATVQKATQADLDLQ